MTTNKSACCGAQIKTIHGDSLEYLCVECQKLCDLASTLPDREQILEFNDDKKDAKESLTSAEVRYLAFMADQAVAAIKKLLSADPSFQGSCEEVEAFANKLLRQFAKIKQGGSSS